MFGAGTPVTAWNQVNPNFFPIQLSTVGPDQDASDFHLLRSARARRGRAHARRLPLDYVPYGRDNAIKNAIVGGPDDPGGAAPGTVGFLGFSFYELYEDKLRPLEIDGQSGDRCVFPSEETISSELYPLERTLRLYTTQRSLNRQEVQAYLKYYLQRSEEISDDLELIPISDAVRRQEIARISDPLAYGETPNGETSEPDPEGVVATTSTQPEVGTPSGDGVDTTTTPEGSAPPTTSTSPTTTTTTTTTAP